MAGNHFSEVTDDNRAGVIWIISLLGIIYSTLAFFVRGMIKWHLIGPDDIVMVVAQIFAYGQYAALFTSLKYGLGRSSEMLAVPSRLMVSKTAFISQILLIFALALSKCSVIFLIRRVFTRDMKHFWLICNALIAFICAWAVVSAVIVSAGCNVLSYIPAQGPETCPGFAARWNVVVALDVVTEIIMLIIPVCFLWHLQMTVDMKARVVLAFAFRIPLIPFAIIFLRLFTSSLPAGAKLGVSVSTPIIWQQIQVAYSLISATIPCLKSFIRSFDTNFGHGDSSEGAYNLSSSNSHPRSRNQSNTSSQVGSQYQSKSAAAKETGAETYKLHPLRPRGSANFWGKPEQKEKNGEKKSMKSHIGKLRPERLKSTTICAAADTGNEDGRNSRGSWQSQAGSQELIIRRDVRFDVRSDYVPGRDSLTNRQGSSQSAKQSPR